MERDKKPILTLQMSQSGNGWCYVYDEQWIEHATVYTGSNSAELISNVLLIWNLMREFSISDIIQMKANASSVKGLCERIKSLNEENEKLKQQLQTPEPSQKVDPVLVP